jgi:hypothetical protein
MRWGVDETGSGSCPIIIFGMRGDEYLGFVVSLLSQLSKYS